MGFVGIELLARNVIIECCAPVVVVVVVLAWTRLRSSDGTCNLAADFSERRRKKPTRPSVAQASQFGRAKELAARLRHRAEGEHCEADTMGPRWPQGRSWAGARCAPKLERARPEKMESARSQGALPARLAPLSEN